LRVHGRECELRLLRTCHRIAHTAWLTVTAVVPAGKGGNTVRQRKRIVERTMCNSVGFDLRIRKTRVAGIDAVRAAQGLHVEHAHAFPIGTDDAVGEAVELVAGGVDGIAY